MLRPTLALGRADVSPLVLGAAPLPAEHPCRAWPLPLAGVLKRLACGLQIVLAQELERRCRRRAVLQPAQVRGLGSQGT